MALVAIITTHPHPYPHPQRLPIRAAINRDSQLTISHGGKGRSTDPTCNQIIINDDLHNPPPMQILLPPPHTHLYHYHPDLSLLASPHLMLQLPRPLPLLLPLLQPLQPLPFLLAISPCPSTRSSTRNGPTPSPSSKRFAQNTHPLPTLLIHLLPHPLLSPLHASLPFPSTPSWMSCADFQTRRMMPTYVR